MSDNEDTNSMIAKLICMSVLFIATLILGTLPIKLFQIFHWNRNERNIYSEVLLCFGGGVLLCTTLLHLLPEVSENLEELDLTNFINLPTAELLMCLGFFAMYFIEECVHFYLHQREHKLEKQLKIDTVKPMDSNHNHQHGQDNHVDHSHFVIEDKTIVTIRGLLIVLALSIHELFEGLAIGLEMSAKNVWYMFGAVCAHKLVISFCIGIELITNNVKLLLIIIYIFTFAIVSPTGIGIGLFIINQSSVDSDNGSDVVTLPSIILQGLASGTLLYVVFFEILSDKRRSGVKQSLAVFIGFIMMTCLTLLESD